MDSFSPRAKYGRAIVGSQGGYMISEEIMDEMEVLSLFNLSTTQEGIKVHKSADEKKILATKRLYDKGMITQVDGGYLTSLGLHAAEHTQALLQMMKPASLELQKRA